MNPILSREIRGRFRDKRSFWLLFGVTALLGLAAALIYANATSFSSAPNYYSRAGAIQDENRGGRQLFQFLALGNTFAWLLIAPALTATGLAKERERGLLESLWLTPFRVAAQVWGRLGAALCFLGALQVAALPIYGIAVLLGGVSLAEIALAGLIIAAAALVGAAFGLWCSARSYRGASALGAAFFGIALWSVLAFFCAQELIRINTPINFFLTFTHPVALLWILLSPGDFVPRYSSLTPSFSARDALSFGLLFQLVLSLLLVWSATRKAAKPLPDMVWNEGDPRFKKWRGAINARKIERQQRREAARTRDAVAGALLYELPVEKFVRFKNPLLSREVRGRFRVRQSGALVSCGRALTFIVAIGCWLFIAFNSFDPITRNGNGISLALGILTFGTLAIGVMSSTALVREREAGTWEGLHLSLLSPREIVRSKWLSPLITFGYWCVPFWILLPVTLSPAMIGAILIVIASLGSVSAWGVFISSRAPHSAAATSWTLASLLTGLVALPVLDEILDIGRIVRSYFFPSPNWSSIGNTLNVDYDSPASRVFDVLWNSYHPFLSINNLFDVRHGDAGTQAMIVALNLIFNGIFIAVILAMVRARLRKTEF